MLNINYSIDFIQETKKQFVRSTVSDERIKAGLLNFVDKQTELCKIVSKNFEEFSKIGFETVMRKGNICKP
jgi:hypothetical protein